MHQLLQVQVCSTTRLCDEVAGGNQQGNYFLALRICRIWRRVEEDQAQPVPTLPT